MTEVRADRPSTDLGLARQRLQRSREELRRQILGGREAGSGPSPLLRGIVIRSISAVTAGRGTPRSSLRLGLAFAAMLMFVMSKRRSRVSGLGVLMALALAGLRFARRG